MALPTNVEILNITAVSSVNDGGSLITQIFGLGNDHVVYRWENMPGTWYAHID